MGPLGGPHEPGAQAMGPFGDTRNEQNFSTCVVCCGPIACAPGSWGPLPNCIIPDLLKYKSTTAQQKGPPTLCTSVGLSLNRIATALS